MSNKYFHDTETHNTSAAERIVPFLISHFHPKSVIDVGCGTGTWLKVFLENGVRNAKGIDGIHLDKSKLTVPQEIIFLQDLEDPVFTSEKFDMAICLEVAEHLKPSVAEQFIRELTLLSDVVVFSAAVPSQEGQNHINEQWLSYWINIFKKFGFEPHDIIRPQFWNDPQVDFWYAQNSCIFINKKKEFSGLDSLQTFHNSDLVHPALLKQVGGYRQRMWKGEVEWNAIGKLLLKKVKSSFK